jgi:hypothetical protein
LVVNVCAPRGELKVELVDDSGRPVPGFALADCVPVRGDGVKLPVRWKGGRDLKELAGKPVRVRFQMTDASLYSFRFHTA